MAILPIPDPAARTAGDINIRASETAVNKGVMIFFFFISGTP
ncbi:hypothetical protein LTSEINV_6562 [Salmonella enterica subsp. enterica serovar Inverness str. R8-3668]|uniref:Uncharacterized protein n=2 Tax=Salmonella enterica I TaxID=59201 RepID=G5S0N0_SALET|nr:hypothetical protein LTSEINV_6562 [Salmonella enterica subsp. enterica serovar Inverness str. R8-3668]EHC99692.1 hypothetical protein LTSEURB_4731 [Salmonella enterica subsp. enterica serovar Urbana str. R8-2977]